MLSPSQFEGRIEEKFVKDPLGKIPLYEYEEKGHKNEYVIMEAKVACDRGTVRVRLKDGVHFVYYGEELTVKIDATSFKNVFKGSLMSYSIAYITEETYRKYQEEIKNPYLRQPRKETRDDLD